MVSPVHRSDHGAGAWPLRPGYRHLVAGFPSPYDEESMTRLVTEVKPSLERV